MTTRIAVRDVACAGVTGPFSFEVEGGEIAVLLTPKDEVSALLTRLLVGLVIPDGGSVALFGSDLSTLTARELNQVRQRVGVSYPAGGLVSNLKVWENLTLPLAYHTLLSPAEIEERGMRVLTRLGYEGRLMELPGLLTLCQKKLIGFGRAMLTDPELMLYDSPQQGLNHEEQERFLRVAAEFHRERPGRASLFITSHPGILDFLPGARTISIAKGQPT